MNIFHIIKIKCIILCITHTVNVTLLQTWQRFSILLQGHPAVHWLFPPARSQGNYGICATVAHTDGHQARLPNQWPVSTEQAQGRGRSCIHPLSEGARQKYCVLRWQVRCWPDACCWTISVDP